METTSKLKLPMIMPSQAQKHVTHNEALALIDTLMHLAVLDDHRNTPPAAANVGDLHIVGMSPSGEWAGKAGMVACFEGEDWSFLAPVEGWRAWVRDVGELKVYEAEGWTSVSAPASSGMLGINTTPDEVNRLAVKSDGVLFSHDDLTPGSGNARLQINRARAAASAHVVFSDNWTGRAEAGLVGDNLFRIKVSPDGSQFSTALSISTTDGSVGINTEPNGADRLAVRDDKAGISQFSVANMHADSAASAAFRLLAANNNYFNFQLYGSGTMYAYTGATMILGTYADKQLRLRTNTTDRMYIFGDGRISINTGTASAQLAVNGAVRVGTWSKNALPSASANGAGSLIYVSDAAGGAVIAFSDGSNWRRVTDRNLVDSPA